MLNVLPYAMDEKEICFWSKAKRCYFNDVYTVEQVDMDFYLFTKEVPYLRYIYIG